MTTTSYKIADSMYLVRQPVSAKTAPATSVETPVDHVLVIDCSGSMTGDLPKMREQIKRKLPRMLKFTDTLSLIWFSGRGQAGILFEAEPVGSLADLKNVENLVDRWLRPVGMTGFKEPLQLVSEVAGRLSKKSGRAVSLFFMSDGCDNQWPRGDVLKAVEDVGTRVQSATFVEYGYYADRQLLTAMAEKCGGALIFSEDFARYEPMLESVVMKKVTSSKRIEIEIKGDPFCGFAFALDRGDLLTFGLGSPLRIGKDAPRTTITVPEDLKEVWYLSPSMIGAKDNAFDDAGLAAAYAATSLFAVRMKPDIVYQLLRVLGDVTYIDQFSTCFGKQKYAAFTDIVKSAAFDPKLRLVQGYDQKRVPREDAFTVLDVLNLLQEDPEARVLLDHPEFKYSRIGRGRVDAAGRLDEGEQAEIARLTEEMKKTKDAKRIRELTDQIAAIANKPEGLKVTRVKFEDGYPILKLTFNEDRPNISMLVKHDCTVDLSKRLPGAPDTVRACVPAEFACVQFRNYAIIKDGLLNIDTLPVRVSAETFAKLVGEGIISKTAGGPIGSNSKTADVMLDLKKLPIINRKMVKALSAEDFFARQYALVKAQAAQKVYKEYAKQLLPEKVSKSYLDLYGPESAAWLKAQGITDYNGYQPPHTTQADTTDVYMGKELKVSLKGLSSLPKVSEVQAKIMKKNPDGSVEWFKTPKLTATGAMMAEAIRDVETFLAGGAAGPSPLGVLGKTFTAAAKRTAIQEWLDAQTKASIARARALIFEIAQATFVTVVGQVWFKEFASLDENTMTIQVGGGVSVECKVEMREIQIPI